MKKLMVLGILAMLLFSCRKNDYACTCTYTFVPIDGSCIYIIEIPNRGIHDYTPSQINDWEEHQRAGRLIVFQGRQCNVTAKCHCIEAVCPEY